ncbi:MAG: FMN-binding protein [Gammaproteobacteria bacterium]|nr:FMN-binding protein [Gammaproteobacteria bacterium]
MNQLTGIDAHAFRVEWQGDVWHLCNGLALVRGETRGYGGPIHLLAALQLETGQDGTDQIVVRGVSVTRHQETPGIADFISQPEHPWLQRLIELGSDRIGNVEAVTGATITSKAILRGLDDITHYPALVRSRCPQ